MARRHESPLRWIACRPTTSVRLRGDMSYPTDEIALTDKQLFARMYRLLSEMRADAEMVLGPHA